MKKNLNFLDYEEKKILQENETCIYCFSKNTYFMRHFNSICRINKDGKPTILGENGKMKEVSSKAEVEGSLFAVLSPKTSVSKGFWVICKNCGKHREIANFK